MNPLLYPMLAQVFLTFGVWGCLVTYRVTTLVRGQIHPQKVAVEAKALEIYRSGINLSDNFENLFEIPVLFFVAILTLLYFGDGDMMCVVLAWAFVALRAVHSVVHSVWNNISLRFGLYLFSTLCLLIIWIKIALICIF